MCEKFKIFVSINFWFNFIDPFGTTHLSSDIKNNNVVDPFSTMTTEKSQKSPDFSHEFNFSNIDTEFSKFSLTSTSKTDTEDPFNVIDSNNKRVTTSNDTNNNFGAAFKADFDDEFSKVNINNLTDMLKKDNKDKFEVNFAQFDAFNNNTLNNTTTSRPTANKIDNFTNNLSGGQKNKAANAPDEITKFKEDYSKNYELDLEEVLRRSMLEK